MENVGRLSGQAVRGTSQGLLPHAIEPAGRERALSRRRRTRGSRSRDRRAWGRARGEIPPERDVGGGNVVLRRQPGPTRQKGLDESARRRRHGRPSRLAVSSGKAEQAVRKMHLSCCPSFEDDANSRKCSPPSWPGLSRPSTRRRRRNLQGVRRCVMAWMPGTRPSMTGIGALCQRQWGQARP